MSYTDGIHTYHYLLRQCETAAAVEKLIDRQGEAASAAAQQVHLPGGGTVVSWGATIQEAITNAHATHAVAILKTVAKNGATAATGSTLTFPNAAGEVTPLTVTSPSDRTAAQAVAIGARLSCTNLMPVNIGPGGYFYIETTVAAGAAGGAWEYFVIMRENGGAIGGTANSPVTKVIA